MNANRSPLPTLSLLALLLPAVCCAEASARTRTAASPTTELAVGAESTTPLSGSVAAGLLACRISDDEVWREVVLPRLIDSPPANLRLCPPAWPAIESSTPPVAGDASYRGAESAVLEDVRVIQPLLDRGWTLSVDIDTVPRWVSKNPEDESTHPVAPWTHVWSYSPPAAEKSDQWVALVKWLAGVYAQAGVHPWYGVGNEPDWTFFGTEAEYLDYYDKTARALKEADPLAHVGGPGVSSFDAKKNVYLAQADAEGHWQVDAEATTAGAPLFSRFVESVGASGAPLDFVDYHFPDELTVGDTMAKAQSALAGAGLPTRLPVRVGEWSHEPADAGASDEGSAAYIVSMLQSMADAGDALGMPLLHNHTSYSDQAGWTDGWWRHVGLASSTNGAARPWGIVRPKLNAFNLLGLFGGGFEGASYRGADRLPITFPSDPLVRALAVRRGDGSIALLLSKYGPANLVRYEKKVVEDRLKAQGVLGVDEILAMEQAIMGESCKQQLASAGQRLTAQTLSNPRFVYQLLDACTALTQEQTTAVAPVMATATDDLRRSAKQPWTGTVKVPLGAVANVTAYRIDAGHANACGYNRSTDPLADGTETSPCGEGGVLDNLNVETLSAGTDAATTQLRTLGWTDPQIAIASDAVDACSQGSEFAQCLSDRLEPGGIPDPALPSTAHGDLLAASSAYESAAQATEISRRAELNARGEVVLTPEHLGELVAGQGLSVDLPYDGTLLLIFAPIL